MTESATQPQEPGADLETKIPGDVPAIDTAKLEKLRKGKPEAVIAGLDELSSDELDMLAKLEIASKKPRQLVLKAIASVAGSRESDALLPHPEIQGESRANIGNRTDYSGMHASEIDPTKLTGPVLSKDGWVLPLPKAEG